ncbi:MAG TPA: choice-of-anchor tandem repeat GloVer-containing protein [Rhizomicrobium sp.]
MQQSQSIRSATIGVAVVFLTIAVAFGGVVSGKPARGSTYTVLYAFGAQRGDGVGPDEIVHDGSGNLYGTTIQGSANGSTSGGGTAFKLVPNGQETVLYSFCIQTNCADGDGLRGGLVLDKNGNLFGVTQAGGNNNNGVVYEIKANGSEMVLHSFTGGSDGGMPIGGLIRGSDGDLYGTTFSGGNGFANGVVFKIAPDGTEIVVHTFGSGFDGAGPEADLTIDPAGNLYGTTILGGANALGTVFELAPDGTEKVVYSFKGGSDGVVPLSKVLLDQAGNVFGTTFEGGNQGCGGAGCGVVFEIFPSGAETVLYTFTGGSDGGNPLGDLLEDQTGNLYGTAPLYGMNGCGGSGCGVVFKLAPDGKEKNLHSFTGGNDGANSEDLIWDPKVQRGTLFGTAGGGVDRGGVVFTLTK